MASLQKTTFSASRYIKNMIVPRFNVPLETGLTRKRKANALLFTYRRQKDGKQAFIKKRTAMFEGNKELPVALKMIAPMIHRNQQGYCKIPAAVFKTVAGYIGTKYQVYYRPALASYICHISKVSPPDLST